jgi:hypothetical protein
MKSNCGFGAAFGSTFLAAVAVLGACHSVDIKEGLPCSPTDHCPTGYASVSNHCTSVGGDGTAGTGGHGAAGTPGIAGTSGSNGSGGSRPLDGGAGAGSSTAGSAGSDADAGTGAAGSSGDGGQATGGAPGTGGASGTGGAPPPPKVTVTLQRTGQGTITGSGVNCVDASCTTPLDVGATLILQANASSGWHLMQWSGCSTVNATTCTVANVSSATQVTATFVQDDASFVIAKAGNGTGTVTATWAGGGSLNCGTACSASVAPGTTIMLTALPATGTTVTWGAPCSGSSSCLVTVAAGGSMVQATFTLQRFLVTVGISGPSGTGSVISTTAGIDINCGSACSALVEYGMTVQLTASPSATGVFASWTGCTTTAGASCSVNVTAAASVTAAFKVKTGSTCSSPSDCTLGFCVNGVCCSTACNGDCNQSCTTGTGACIPKPARSACGAAFQGPHNVAASAIPDRDVFPICDGQGNCTGPKVRCGPSHGLCTASSTTACCDTQTTPGSTACRSASTCYGVILNCISASDCPVSQLCCVRTALGGEATGYCAASCQNDFEACDPSAPTCSSGGTCTDIQDTGVGFCS